MCYDKKYKSYITKYNIDIIIQYLLTEYQKNYNKKLPINDKSKFIKIIKNPHNYMKAMKVNESKESK